MPTDVEAEDAISVMGTDLTGSGSVLEEVGPVKEASHDSIPAINAYQIKPTLEDKFKSNPVKEVIRNVLSEKLSGRVYDSDIARKLTITIANDINTKVRDIRMKRYKHIVQVTIGELKGAGVKSGVRCLWDSETDGYTSETFMNDTIFCVVVVFAVYLY